MDKELIIKMARAIELALEALEESLGYVQEEAENAQRLYGQYPTRQARIQGLKDDARKHMDAITALREALAEQCVCGEPDTPGTHRTDGPCLAEQPAQQKPVAWQWLTTAHFRKRLPKNAEKGAWNPLYISPPASKPLTDEQRNWVVATCPTPRHIIDTVEKMHGIKGDA